MIWVKRTKNKFDWHKWFAWYPVTVVDDNTKYVAWLSYIERKVVLKEVEVLTLLCEYSYVEKIKKFQYRLLCKGE